MTDQQPPLAADPTTRLLHDFDEINRAACCGDPTNLDGNAHPWVHVSEDGPGDVYRCPVCGATDVD